MTKPMVAFAVLASLFVENDLSARPWRLLRRSNSSRECQQAFVELTPIQSKEQKVPMKPDYASQLQEMTEKAVWCKVTLESGRFLVRAEKLRKPLSDLARQAHVDFKDQELDDTPPIGPDLSVEMLGHDGERTGGVGFWTKGLAGRTVLPEIYLACKGASGNLGFGAEAVLKFKSDIKPALYNVENNCEALSSGKTSLVCLALEAIVQAEFRNQQEKTIELMEPFLRSGDRTTRRIAAEMLLRVAPNHKEAKRVLSPQP